MTRLLDSGYLETDSPIVAACFLGREVYDPIEDVRGTLEILGRDYHGQVFYQVESKSEMSEPATILIPAATVAEVVGWGERQTQRLPYRVFLEAGGYQAAQQWLITHTGEGE